MKRFYKEAESVAQDGGFAVLLDGRPVRTPGRNLLLMPAPTLAEAVAAEWGAQTETIRPAEMPLTQLASTALDRIVPQAGAVAAELARYAETDLVCYRAAGPPELVRREGEAWSPLLEWLAAARGARLLVTTGVQPIPQPAAAIAAVQAALAAFPPFPLAALSSATAATGSVVIGLALAAGRISGAEAADAAFVDENFQMEVWGSDREEVARLARLRADLAAAERFLALLA